MIPEKLDRDSVAKWWRDTISQGSYLKTYEELPDEMKDLWREKIDPIRQLVRSAAEKAAKQAYKDGFKEGLESESQKVTGMEISVAYAVDTILGPEA